LAIGLPAYLPVTPVRKIGRAVGHGIVGPVTWQALVSGTARRLTAPRRGEAAGPSTADSGLTVLNSDCPALTYPRQRSADERARLRLAVASGRPWPPSAMPSTVPASSVAPAGWPRHQWRGSL